SQRLLGLVDQLLDLARHDAGQLRLKVRRGDLAALLRQRVESFLPLAERCRVELSLRLQEGRAELYFDAAELEKVFDNLLSNALKFTPPGGRVDVALTAPPGSGRVEVTVEDSGPGIPADQVDRVFDRFYQVESADRRPSPGVGLGLALARHLVELHGGSIAAASREGKGARFTVTLRRGRDHFPAELLDETAPPAAAPAEAPDQAPVRSRALPTPLPPLPEPGRIQPAPDDERMTVLVVDDNADIRAYIRRHLEPGYRVVEAADGAEALAQARRSVPDLVVSDIMMPGLDGHALFRALRLEPELELVPVILLTAKASPESRLQGLREGADDYLLKPFDPWELKARVDNLIASRRRLAERLTGVPQPLRAREIEATAAATPAATPADEAFVARAQAVIEERLGDPELTVEALAAALRCDRSYLLRKLRALTGESPSDLIRSLRLQRAEQLLKTGAGTVGEIAYAVGFKSVAHFSNAFHQRYGERPSAFALRHRSR
ncbi:MAG TPA: ATP-binding protein, partial [Thermoanaerobaculia bacterium]|nr:ATP-binding protein [Thermoanaerobaculia bacterium]